MYKIVQEGVRRLKDMALIPEDEMNRDWQEYQSWIKSGNVPEAEFSDIEVRDAARKEIESIRYEYEVLGVNINGMTILSDRDTQMKLTSAALRAQRDEGYSLDWKCTDGVFVHLVGQEIIDIADIVGDYVQACYTRESQLLKLLEEGVYNEDELYTGWPSNVINTN